VRGRRKAMVATLLSASAGATGALAGFAAGVLALPLGAFAGRPGAPAVGVAAAAAVVLDAVAARSGRFAPPSVRRQVPREWSRLFTPPAVALLYGARLGVGPLTILPTWLWWAASALGAWAGPWPSTAAGAVFGVARTLLMVVLAEWVAPAAPARMTRLRAAESRARTAAAAAVLAVAAVLILG
jgi:hypothetical protein